MTIESKNSNESEPTPEVIIKHSVQDETNRVKWTLSRLNWYKENGYNTQKIRLPEHISKLLEEGKGLEVVMGYVEESVSGEYDGDEFDKLCSQMLEKWNEIKDDYFEKIKTLGLPLQDKYHVSLTKYGMGGSYSPPDGVSLSVGQEFNESHYILAHEIIHLTIEQLILEYDIDQWTKETIVDLTMNKFFPERQKIQRKKENFEKIREIFKLNFPNMTEIVDLVSKIDQNTK